MWSKKYCDSNGQKLSEVLNGFLDYINFHMIPANVLMKEIHPLGIVPYHIIMNALAYQADPTSVEPIKHTTKEVISIHCKYFLGRLYWFYLYYKSHCNSPVIFTDFYCNFCHYKTSKINQQIQ